MFAALLLVPDCELALVLAASWLGAGPALVDALLAGKADGVTEAALLCSDFFASG